MEILELNENNYKLWNSLAITHPQVRFCQLLEYKHVLEEVFGYEGIYLLFMDNDSAVGLLPLFVTKTLLFNKIESIPFSQYGGIISNSPEKLDFALINKYINKLLTKYGANYLEINAGLGLPAGYMESNYQALRFHDYAELKLETEEKLWLGVDHQVRKAVNKAKRLGIVVFEDNSEKAVKEYFYPLFLKSMHLHGTPPVSLSYFYKCRKYFKDKMKIFYAQDSGRIVAALLGYIVGKRVYLDLIVSDEKSLDKRPVDIVHWDFIRWGVKNNLDFFDFGLVRYEGQRRFKLKWGCTLKDYNYFYLFPSKNSMRELPVPLTPLSWNINFFKFVWKLTPLVLQNKIGPWVRWNLAK